MRKLSNQRYRVLVVVLALATATVTFSRSHADTGTKGAASDRVDGTSARLWPYRTLAELAYEASIRGDFAATNKLAKVLEATWDAAEGAGGDDSVRKLDENLYGGLDRAMDAFLKAIARPAKDSIALDALKAAYAKYEEQLRQGDIQLIAIEGGRHPENRDFYKRLTEQVRSE